MINTYVDAAQLGKQVNGVATNETQFCSGVKLTFVCNIRATSYLWEVGPLLKSTSEGLISIGEDPTVVTSKTVDGITLTAQGQSNSRTSSLTLTTSVQLNGHEVMCYEHANKADGVRKASVFVWGEYIPSYNFLCQPSLDIVDTN